MTKKTIIKLSATKNIILKDDDMETDGTAYIGESLYDFLISVNSSWGNTDNCLFTKEEINEMLAECGIMPITDEQFENAQNLNSMKEIKIGAQIWNDKNLALTTDRDGNDLILNKDYFYPSGIKSLVPKYGLLYTWEAAMRVVPIGWHLPANEEWDELVKVLPNEEFASSEEWRKGELAVKEEVLFDALPAGYYDGYNGDYCAFGDLAYFWSFTEYDDRNAYYRGLSYCYASVYSGGYNKSYGFSVRCVKV